ncbi:hypothetical protein B0T18DRAFT_437417 [Schizothecium vesticola]|uniref:Sodium/calcium exchanger membrane region domain-containing protein n=1 Tax=Schizothecium vesticola TaxID=314040 RepID=A0AA40F2V7_9PEZI|nr:hypothetical protein B0T18DRAFT_437417 [Schizothecium vesticola]
MGFVARLVPPPAAALLISSGPEHLPGGSDQVRSSVVLPRSDFTNTMQASSCTASQYVNLRWPLVPVALVLQLLPHQNPLAQFLSAYLAVIPTANLVGFAGQEFARKMPKVMGILIEVAFGGVVEVVLFLVLILKSEEGEGDLIPIIQAAILGSILTNLLLCLGLCFFVGGLRQARQKFHAIVPEGGRGCCCAFYSALKGEVSTGRVGVLLGGHSEGGFAREKLQEDVLQVSRAASVALIRAFYGIFDEVIEMDEHRDTDQESDREKLKFTMTETVVALYVSLKLVTLLLVFLAEDIEYVVEAEVPDQFLELILLPLVEKAAEHLTTDGEAWDGVINVALYHCLAPSIQTALLNGPLVVLVGWVLGKPMDLHFEIFMIGLLVLSILVVGNFLRDGESNWLEGALLVVVYVIIAISCWYYPNPDVATSNPVDGLINVPMTPETLQELQRILSLQNIGSGM